MEDIINLDDSNVFKPTTKLILGFDKLYGLLTSRSKLDINLLFLLVLITILDITVH